MKENMDISNFKKPRQKHLKLFIELYCSHTLVTSYTFSPVSLFVFGIQIFGSVIFYLSLKCYVPSHNLRKSHHINLYFTLRLALYMC